MEINLGSLSNGADKYHGDGIMSRTREAEQQQLGRQLKPNEQGNKYKGNHKPEKKKNSY